MPTEDDPPAGSRRPFAKTSETTVRRFWIHNVLPVAFAAVPVLAALLLFAAIPADARKEYFNHVAVSAIDWIIIALGFTLFTFQVVLTWKALRWREAQADFDHRADRWVNHLSQGAEWFPLLGLIGTVVAILQTFSSITPGARPEPRRDGAGLAYPAIRRHIHVSRVVKGANRLGVERRIQGDCLLVKR